MALENLVNITIPIKYSFWIFFCAFNNESLLQICGSSIGYCQLIRDKYHNLEKYYSHVKILNGLLKGFEKIRYFKVIMAYLTSERRK